MDKQLQALSLVKYVIVYGYKHNLFLKKLMKKWDDDGDLMSRCAKLQIDANNTYLKTLYMILKLLTKNCKHPKKYHDRTGDGVWYCMNCNGDLPKLYSK